MLLYSLWMLLAFQTGAKPALTGTPTELKPHAGMWRGVYFNPQVDRDPNFPWLIYYKDHRTQVRGALHELREETRINLVDLFVMIPNSLRIPAHGNQPGEKLETWANTEFLKNVSQFVDDCHEAGLGTELDLVDNRWIPQTIDSHEHIGAPGNRWWPVAENEPRNWQASAEWYKSVIEYVEAHCAHPEAIAMWSMMGNYHWGAAEPVLWDSSAHPEIAEATHRFVTHVWPAFRAAGKRPKASPIMLPILSNNAYWLSLHPSDRLKAFSNLKTWLVDELKLSPDYWVMSTYPFCDPATDGVHYIREIVEILGHDNVHRIVSTDLKAEGHETEVADSIISNTQSGGVQALNWQLQLSRRYGFAGWWIWAYQDTPDSRSGIRRLDGSWKSELVKVMQSGAKERPPGATEH